MYTRDALSSLADVLPNWQEAYPVSTLSVVKTNGNDSDKAIADTIALMGKHARDASSSTQVRQALGTAGCLQSGLTEDACIEKVFRYIKSNVRFVEDETQLAKIFGQPSSKELLITPPVLLSMARPQGDCDDFSMLACSMLMAKGIQCDFVTVAANADQPKEFSHVYCMARSRDGRSIPIDASHGSYVGWETERSTRKQVWPVFNWGTRGRGNGMAGLGSDSVDFSSWFGQVEDPNLNNYGYSSVNNPTTSKPSIDWNNILPGIFLAGEKLALQTTQQPGVQTMGPNGQYSSTVLPAGATSLANFQLPGVSTLSGGTLPIILAAAVALFLFTRK